MADREKLFDLMMRDPCPSQVICNPNCKYYKSHHCHAERYADHLISHGVTVRERGRWVRAGGDLHYSGVLYCCSVCSKRHFVNGRHALVTLSYHDELFRTPNFCPNCGADMRGEQDGK